MKLLINILSAPIHFYRWVVSPYLPARCRYFPTCSNYALQALRQHGPFRGVWLSLRRIGRCHPWGGHGFDPVPDHEECGHKHALISPRGKV